MLWPLLALSIAVSATALLYARYEYRKRGKLSALGLGLLCVMFFVPNLIVEYATRYAWPSGWLDYVGIMICALGLILLTAGITMFASVLKVLCMDAGELTLSGIYRRSRNPQYVGYLLALFGFTLTDWSWWCLAPLVVVALSVHLLVLIEEEHLLRTFGEPYAEYKRRVPRYLIVTSSSALVG